MAKRKKDNKPNYKSWISKKIIFLTFFIWIVGAILTVFGSYFSSAFGSPLKYAYVWIPGMIIFAVGLFFFASYSSTAYLLKPEGKDIINKVHTLVIDKLQFDEDNNKILDIGCGSGQMAIRLAKSMPDSSVVGVDFWKGKWEYSKELCERNARLEDVDNIDFVRGSAANLEFKDAEFDGVVSNYVFHEVKTSDKKQLIGEAVRVLKPGGKFAIHDLFLDKKKFGEKDELIAYLDSLNLTEYKLESTNELDFMQYIKYGFEGSAILYGTK